MMPGSTLGKCGEECARWSGPPSWQIVRGIRVQAAAFLAASDTWRCLGQGTAFKTNARNYTDTDASDIDFVDLPGNSTHPPTTYVVYCTGNQQVGYAYNAAAMVDAPLQAWLQSYF